MNNLTNRNYTKSKWYRELKEGGASCIYCGEKLTDKTFTVDHIIPRSKGGRDDAENCKPCCHFCNTLKADMSFEDFNSKYPKEKILKLKKYTDTNRQLNESELYKSINDRIEQACDLLNSIKKEHWECKNVLNVYEKLSKEVRSEFALGENLSASNGYKAYQKIRNIERNILRLKAEESVLRSFCDKYKSIDSSLNKLKTGLKQKQHSRTNSHYKPLLELDIREQIEKELENNEY